MEDNNVMKTGTTTVAIVCKEGIVMAADKRATAGYLIANKKTEKILKLTDKIAVTIAGSASDAALLVKIAQAELRLKGFRTNREILVTEAAHLLSRMVYQNIRKFSIIPGIAHFLCGGQDSTGLYVYDIFPDGSIDKVDDFISSGSGSVMVYGVLETLYKKDMSVNEGVELAIKCVNAAIQRDIASGNGIQVITITKDGIKTALEKEINNRIEH